MSDHDPREHQDESSRRRIVDAAAEIVAEAGYHGTTIAKVTERSGLPASSIYWFFKDKDELVAEVVRGSIEAWLATRPPWQELPDDASASELLTRVVGSAVREMVGAPPFLRIGLMLLLEQGEKEPSARRQFVQLRERTEDGIAAVLERRLDPARPGHTPELARDVARTLVAAVDGLFLASQIDDDWDPAAEIPLVVTALLAGVGIE